MTTKKLRVLSLFTGAGGLDSGLHGLDDFDLLACVELNETYCRTLAANRDAGLLGSSKTRIIQADLASYLPEDLMAELEIGPEDVDVIIGGPPCQAFSTAGRRRSVQDPRGELLWSFLRYVEAFQPDYFIMENVRGLLSAALRHRPIAHRPDKGGPPLSPDEQPGSVVALWADDLRHMAGDAYRIDTFEVNAVNYGAPQIRERVLFFGNRLNEVISFPPPTHEQYPTGDMQPFRTLRDALYGLTEESQTLLDFSPRKKGYLQLIPEGGNWRFLPESIAKESMGRAWHAKGGRSGWWRRLSWDLPSPTIVTMPNHASTSMCHPTETRVLSVAECARIQEFPDGWTFVGRPAEQYTQVGNAVPSRLGKLAGQVLLGEAGSKRRATEDDPDLTQTYLKSHVRTRQWFKAGEAILWDPRTGTGRYGAA